MEASTSVCAPFKHPSTILVAGPTGSGKTEFLVQLLNCKGLYPFPERIVWIYSEWQNAYDRILNLKLRNTKVQFVKDYDDDLYDSLNPKVRNLVVLDDQMENKEMHRGGSGLAKFFTQGSHHRNLTVIYIVQNMFHQSKSMRTISLNSHYLVLFKNPRDKLQIRNLAAQMHPNNAKFLVSAYEDATNEPYGYLVVDLRPETPEQWRIRTNFFSTSGQTVYVPS
jgi:energy-coupling factor transporter ATP-binding protein EcfA2